LKETRTDNFKHNFHSFEAKPQLFMGPGLCGETFCIQLAEMYQVRSSSDTIITTFVWKLTKLKVQHLYGRDLSQNLSQKSLVTLAPGPML
jgi:hypothetical protein